MIRRNFFFIFFIVSVVVGIPQALAVRHAEVSSFVNTGSRVALAFFHSPHFLYSGGVSPRERSLVFKSNDGAAIEIRDLDLRFQVKNSDSVEVNIEYQKELYRVPMQSKMLCPLLRFVA